MDILLGELEVIYSPTFIDLREVPKVEVAIVEGGVRTESDEEIVR